MEDQPNLSDSQDLFDRLAAERAAEAVTATSASASEYEQAQTLGETLPAPEIVAYRPKGGWVQKHDARLRIVSLLALAFLLLRSCGSATPAPVAVASDTGFDAAAKTVASAWSVSDGKSGVLPYSTLNCGSPLSAYPNPQWTSFNRSLGSNKEYVNEIHEFTASNGSQFSVTLRVRSGAVSSSVSLISCPTPLQHSWANENVTSDALLPVGWLPVSGAEGSRLDSSLKAWANAFWTGGNDSVELLRLTGDTRSGVHYDGLGRTEAPTVTPLVWAGAKASPGSFLSVVNLSEKSGSTVTFRVLIEKGDTATPVVTSWGPAGSIPVTFSPARTADAVAQPVASLAPTSASPSSTISVATFPATTMPAAVIIPAVAPEPAPTAASTSLPPATTAAPASPVSNA
jgi:hypothetical protein